MCYNIIVLLFNLCYNLSVVLSNLNNNNEGIFQNLKSGFPASNRDRQLYDEFTTWNKGIVPYYVDTESYDSALAQRLRAVMTTIEVSSCVVFKRLSSVPTAYNGSWLHFTNPTRETDCVHESTIGESGEIIMVLGFHCMKKKDILHAVLHAIGFKDEVTHPQRDLYIKILWDNLQPKYRSLFRIQSQKELAEYDPLSVMHFHDRAYSTNGGATIAPLVPGLQIRPSNSLSLLDMMKLRLYYGHECKKRKVDDLLDTCKDVLHESVIGKKYDNSDDYDENDNLNSDKMILTDETENGKDKKGPNSEGNIVNDHGLDERNDYQVEEIPTDNDKGLNNNNNTK
ncbi:hypothetical protein K1T71_011369 [Dendrolimus kikuchii]|uniref:Uncharacterized protein n=1 Tax=Dendrolimus kikuchii TaxID=765133 RepID=A0ACC1CNL4_9NEOP|nr:hypothetical protein K1T71_011369 [Dendrolimus kikuchii]